jgi:hypothetical protein
MSNVIEFDDKLIEKTAINVEVIKLSKEIKKFLPIYSIPNNLIDYCCRVYAYEKTHEYDWMDKIDCYLGLPDYAEKEESLNNFNCEVFPLSLVYSIGQQSMNNFNFSLPYTSDDEETYLLHFNYATFADHLVFFEEKLETNLESWVKKVTLKWKALIKKIKDNPYKHAQLRIETQLSHYYNTFYKYNLRQSTLNGFIKEYFDFSIGQDYGTLEHYKKRGEFEDIVEGVNLFDVPKIYEIFCESDDEEEEGVKFKHIFPTLDLFGLEINQHYFLSSHQFEEDPTNHVIERELDFIRQIFLNTNKRLLKKWAVDIEILQSS